MRITPFAVSWSGFLISRQACRPRGIDYWCRIAAEQCFVYELAGAQLPEAIDAWAYDLLDDPGGGGLLSFRDPALGVWRWVKQHHVGLEACLFISNKESLPGRDWLLDLFRRDTLDMAAQRTLLSGASSTAATDEGWIVCACFRVRMKRLATAIREQKLTSVAAIGQALQAGTNCGSCLPELEELLARQTGF